MLKERKIKENYNNITKEINSEEYYYVETKDDNYEGVYLNFNLNTIDTMKYFGEDLSEELFPKSEMTSIIEELLKNNNINDYDVDVETGYFKIALVNRKLDDEILKFCNKVLHTIRNYYSNKGVHITRMFGSYILLTNENGELKAIKATPIPIKYCPLMVKLLKEVGGELAGKLLQSLDVSDSKKQSELMCELINQIVIKAGYFDTNRPLNSCEANVLFGASETISSAFKTGMLDASVIVSNNLGTIITTNEFNTQGAVKRMTGLFYTSPSDQIMSTAWEAGIIPVFPYTGEINQIEGIKRAINMGYKKIAVTFAAQDNKYLEQIKDLESDDIIIYKFGLCSTGIDEKTAMAMLENADIIWSCASKYVKQYIEPNAIAQVGIKIPVHIMTKKGWELVKNHLKFMQSSSNFDEVTLCEGEEKPVVLNQGKSLKLIKKKELHNCNDCPHPCI